MAFFSRDEGHRWWNLIGKIQSNFSKSMKKVIGFVDVQRGIHLNKSGYVHRRNFDELLEYEISLESFHLCWKSEQLFEKILTQNSVKNPKVSGPGYDERRLNLSDPQKGVPRFACSPCISSLRFGSQLTFNKKVP